METSRSLSNYTDLVIDYIQKPLNVLRPRKGYLLVSDPFLRNSVFERCVILLCAHDAQGTFGLILNKFVEVEIPEILRFKMGDNPKIGLGGPVDTEYLQFLHCSGHEVSESIHVVRKIFFGGDYESMMNHMDPSEAEYSSVRFFAGYTGWEPGQLDSEIQQQSWYVTKPGKLKLMDIHVEDMWKKAIIGMGPEFVKLANFPVDPQHN